MKMVSILPVDSYIVVNKSILNEFDKKILLMLYQPLIGSLAVSLYLSLWTDLNKLDIVSAEYTHHHLMANTKMSLEEIVKSRKELEALGLLKTYYKTGTVNNYVYELYSPLSANEFLSNPLLSISLFSSIGKKEYESIVSYFKIPKVNLDNFENISVKFSDIYKFNTKEIEDVTQDNIKHKEKLDIMVDDFVDFDFVYSNVKGLINKNAFDKNTKSLINKLAYLYNFDNIVISNMIKNSINEKGLINEVELKKNCKNYYTFENKGSLPNIMSVNKFKVDDVKEPNDVRDKLIYCFSNANPYDFLKAKYNGGKPTSKDVSLLEGLIVEQKLNPGVINVLIDYVLRVNDKKLNKNLVEAIASQWKMLGIDNVESAMKQAEKEYKKHQKYKEQKKEKNIKQEEKLPNWYGKEIKKEEMSKEEEEELKNMLKEFM